MAASARFDPFPAVIGFDGPLPEPLNYRPAAERILAGDPAQKAWTLYESTDGRFSTGIWQAERGTWRVVFTESEFCHLIEGVIIVTGDDGSVRTFKAGDTFVSPSSFTGTWEIVEPAKKFFAIYE